MSVDRRKENLPPETRAKMSASAKKRKHSPETKAKLSVISKARVISPETRKKMSESRRTNKLKKKQLAMVCNEGQKTLFEEQA